MSRDIKQSAKISWSKVLKSYRVCSLIIVDYVRNQYQKVFENNPYISTCNMTFIKRDLQLSHLKPQ